MITPTSTTTENVTLCSGSSYTFPDGTVSTNITANESQTSTLTSGAGCDSIIVTNITIGSAVTASVDITLCSGADFTYADGTVSTGITANESNTSTLTSVSGCDSLLTENILITPISTTSGSVTLCSGSDYTYPDGTISTNITASESHPSTLISGAGCDSIVVVNVNIVNGFTNSEYVVICAGEDVQFPDGTILENVTHDMNYTYVFTSSTGCDSTIVTNVIIEPSPIASFIANETVLNTSDTEVEFTNTSINATSYLWDFGDGLPNESIENPVHVFPEAYAGYSVTLYAFNNAGCVDSAYLTIQVEELLIYYIPNAFTPDGDEFNQTFKPIFTSGYDPFDYNLYIYNRWGELVFESHDTNIGWDGTFNGQMIQDGVYVWKVDFKTIMSDERVMDVGHVNLLR